MRNSFHILIAGFLALLCSTSAAQDNTSALIPMPNHIEKCSKGKTFEISRKTTIYSNLPQESFIIEELKEIVRNRTGITPGYGKSNSNRIELNVDPSLTEAEHYTLKVDKNGITIKGATEGALFWGLKTLDQLFIGDACNTAARRIEIGRAHV